MTATPTPLRELLAKAIADHIGHGMAEKCEGHADAVLAVLSARDAAGAVTEWRWVDERGRAMTNWKQGEPPPMTAVSDTRGTMCVEVRTIATPPASGEAVTIEATDLGAVMDYEIATAPAASGDDIEQIREQADAWEAVFKTLLEVAPGWHSGYGCAMDKACDTIRRLAAVATAGMDGAVALIATERQRQVSVEGWTPDHDDRHDRAELASAAACYAAPARVFVAKEGVGRDYEPYTFYRDLWPWAGHWWKPKDRVRDLVRAGALIVAEIERLQRAAPTPPATAGEE